MTDEKAIKLVKERCSHFYYMIPVENEPLTLDSEVVIYDTGIDPVLRTTIRKLIPAEIDKETAQKFEPSIWHLSGLIDYDEWHKLHPFAVLPPVGEPPVGIPFPMFKNELIRERLRSPPELFPTKSLPRPIAPKPNITLPIERRFLR